MTDEVLNTTPEEPIQQEPVVETAAAVGPEAAPPREYSEIELQAIEMGWKPLEEFNGDTTLFKSAEKFVEQKPLYDKLEATNRKTKEVEKLLKQSIEYNRKLAQREKDKELELLRYKRQEAVSLGDEETFAEADKAYIAKLQTPVDPIVEMTTEPLADEDVKEIAAFKERNKTWCNDTTEDGRMMSQAAAAMCSMLEKDMPGKSSREYLALVEKGIKAAFPHKFKNAARSAPAAVGSGSRPVGAAPAASMAGMSDYQKHMMQEFVKAGGKASEYIDQLKQLGRL